MDKNEAKLSFLREAFLKDENRISARKIKKSLDGLEGNQAATADVSEKLADFYRENGIVPVKNEEKKRTVRWLPAVSCACAACVLLLVLLPGVVPSKQREMAPPEEGRAEASFSIAPEDILPFPQGLHESDFDWLHAEYGSNDFLDADQTAKAESQVSLPRYVFTDASLQEVTLANVTQSRIIAFLQKYDQGGFSEGASSGYKLLVLRQGTYYYIDLTQEMVDYLTQK